ncbi:hypothetical protein JKP88DRAFT_353331 [Tribonema minus]|uniref:CCAAT-binding factor domain-containing protein n=1 Tax=Tribonema minus TaxID=303371 RepID=A0A835ZC94_9STRA|nr:hypothetical protein JKP88DRAFT_353331 [Tribonema minus]
MAKKSKPAASQQPAAVENGGGAEDARLRAETLAMIKELGIADEQLQLVNGDRAKQTPAAPASKKHATKSNKTEFAKGAATGINGVTAGGDHQQGSKVKKSKPQGKADSHQHQQQNGGRAPPPSSSGSGGSGSAALALSLTLKHPACALGDDAPTWLALIPPLPGSKSSKKKQKQAGKAEGRAAAAAAAAAPAPPHERAPAEVVRRLRDAAAALLAKEVAAWDHGAEKRQTGDDRYLSQVLKSGTLSDKISALTMRCKESPVHRLADLDKLVELATKHDRRTAQMAQEALKDLFISDLLPDERRLVPFRERPLLQFEEWAPNFKEQAAKTLLMWYFEGELLRRYGALVTALDAATKVRRYLSVLRLGGGWVAALHAATKDSVSNTKRSGMEAARDLLEAKPTGEAQLLAILVNKFGDPDRKVANKGIHLLQHALPQALNELSAMRGIVREQVLNKHGVMRSQVLNKHTAMRSVVVREVQQYLHRPGLAPKALYAGVVFLSQVYLTAEEDGALAAELIGTYFKLFELAVQAGDLKSRLLSALLTGVNRAHPYLDSGSEALATHVDELFKLVHQSNFSTATQALMLLFQVIRTSAPAATDRDNAQRPPRRHKKGFGAPPLPSRGGDTVAGGKNEAALATRFYKALYAKLADADLRLAHQPALFLNLVYRAMKGDAAAARVAAFAKRLLQTALSTNLVYRAMKRHEGLHVTKRLLHAALFLNLVHCAVKEDAAAPRIALLQVATLASPPLAGASLFVVSEVLKKHQALRSVLFAGAPQDPPAARDAADGAAAEGDATAESGKIAGETVKAAAANGTTSSGTSNGGVADASKLPPEATLIPGYDPSKRDPRFAFGGDGLEVEAEDAARAGGVALWEATQLRWHYHPSVAHFALELLTPPGHGIRYKGDPLVDFGLMPFLDRLAYRNAKQSAAPKGGMARSAATKRLTEADIVNDEAFANLPLQAAFANLPLEAVSADIITHIINDEAFANLPLEAVSADKVFFHRFFREKAHRDSVKGLTRKKHALLDEDAEEAAMDAALERRSAALPPSRTARATAAAMDAAAAIDAALEGEADSDAEESAYADKLARALMRSAGDNIASDDEDPDTADWSMDEDETGGGFGGETDDDEGGGGDGGARGAGDDDDFMDDGDGSSDEEGVGGGFEVAEESGGSDDGGVFGGGGEGGSDSDDDAQLPGELSADGDSGDDNDGEAPAGKKRGKGAAAAAAALAAAAAPSKKKRKSSGLEDFASADDYAAMLDTFDPNAFDGGRWVAGDGTLQGSGAKKRAAKGGGGSSVSSLLSQLPPQKRIAWDVVDTGSLKQLDALRKREVCPVLVKPCQRDDPNIGTDNELTVVQTQKLLRCMALTFTVILNSLDHGGDDTGPRGLEDRNSRRALLPPPPSAAAIWGLRALPRHGDLPMLLLRQWRNLHAPQRLLFCTRCRRQLPHGDPPMLLPLLRQRCRLYVLQSLLTCALLPLRWSCCRRPYQMLCRDSRKEVRSSKGWTLAGAKLTQQEQEMKREHQRLRAQQQRRHELQLEAQRMTQRHDREQLALRIAKEVYQQKCYATYAVLAEDTSAGLEGRVRDYLKHTVVSDEHIWRQGCKLLAEHKEEWRGVCKRAADIGVALHTVKTEVTQTAEAAAFGAGLTDLRKARITVLKNKFPNQGALNKGQQQQQHHHQQDKEEGGAAKPPRAPGSLEPRVARVVKDELAASGPPAETDYTPFLGSAGPPGSRSMNIVLPADAFPVTGYNDPTRHLPLMVDVTCFEAQVAIGEQGRKLLEAVATEYASRMSVPEGARPKALKGIALARLRSALSAALHMAYSGRVMTHMAESRGGGHMEEDVGEDVEMPFGGGGV